MAQSGYTPILIYASGTATNVPLAADMTSTSTGAELAINYADGKLYYKNSSNVVTLLASTSGASGDVVGPASATDNALARFDLTTGKLIQNSVGILSDAGILTGLTGITSSGPITLSSLTSGRVTFAGASGLLSDSASLTFDGTSLTTPRLVLGGTTLPSAGTATLFSRTSDNNTYLQTGSGNNFNLLDGSQNTMATFSPTALNFNISNTAKLTLNSTTLYTASGVNVGIGLSNPLVTLHVSNSVTNTAGAGTELLQLANTRVNTSSSGAAISFVTNEISGSNQYKRAQITGEYDDSSDVNGRLLFATANTSGTLVSRMRIDSNGNVGIGTATATIGTRLVLATDDTATTGQLRYARSADPTFYWETGRDNQVSGDFLFSNASGGAKTERMRITSAGSVGIGTSSPTATLDLLSPTNGYIAKFKGQSTYGYIAADNSSATGGGAFSARQNGVDSVIFGCEGGVLGTTSIDGAIFAASVGGALKFYTNASATAKLTLDSSGNLGLGVTPASWLSTWKALQISNRTSLAEIAGITFLGNNFYQNSSSQNIYLETGYATLYSQNAGQHNWQIAPSGTAGNVITLSTAMTLDASGRLNIGATSAPSQYPAPLNVTATTSGAAAITILGRSSDNVGNLYFNNNSGGTNYAYISASSVDLIQFNTTATGAFTFGTNSLERMRIDSSGNVGIGTSSPSSYVTGLAVSKSTTNGGDIALVKTDSGTANQGGQAIRFYNYGPAQTGRSADVNLGSIYWLASQPTSGVAQDAAWIQCLSESQNGGQTPSQLAFWTASTGGITKAMTIDSQQNVGISTTNAASFTTFPSKLVVGSGTGGQNITIYSGTTSEGNIIFADGTTGTQQYRGVMRYDHADDGMKFYVNGGTFGMMINSSADLLVGTTNNTTNGGFIFSPTYNGTGISAAIIGHSSAGGNGNQYMIFNYNGTGIGSIAQSGTTAVLYNVTSDQRLKTNIVDAPSGNIDEIKVRSFDWVADGSHQEYGMVAQELLEVAPYAVCNPTNPDEMMGVDYSKLVPMMIKEIQDLKQRIATLENK